MPSVMVMLSLFISTLTSRRYLFGAFVSLMLSIRTVMQFDEDAARFFRFEKGDSAVAGVYGKLRKGMDTLLGKPE